MRKTKLAQISDPHVCAEGQLFEWRDTAKLLRRALEAARGHGPDAFVLTGDLVDTGSRQEYGRLFECLAAVSSPVYLVAGNHDDRDALRDALGGHVDFGCGDFIQYRARVGEVRLIVLDTQATGHAHGELCDKRLGWLSAELASDPSTPTIVAMHHPPFPTYIDSMDKYGLARGATQFEKLVAGQRNIERIVCGHVHRTLFKRFGGTIASTCSSSAVSVALDLDHARFAWAADEPAFQLHVWAAADGLVTHLAEVPRAGC